jgi:beta-N-acetylhexosaminidase
MFMRLFRLFLIVILLPFSLKWNGETAAARQSVSLDYAKSLLEKLQPEERVGQLFLVTFDGFEAGPSTQMSEPNAKIYNLIDNYHIGGVVLLASNDNFVGSDQTLPVAQSLTRQLQIDEYNSSQQEKNNPVTGEKYYSPYIPMFVGITQEGDGSGYDQILSGLTPLPSQMAIGATWQPEEARKVGEVLGSELKAMGFNLLLGPSLDVLEAPFSENGGDLGVRTFGGDPFWVGTMSQAYITGVHQGSAGSIAVVAKHFPGFGGADRLPQDEVATVKKSLEELKQIELKPFFAVTGNAATQDATTDALLTSHIRYRGLQGNRDTTKPVSFDATAFSQLMSLPEFTQWRLNGGVMISDDLGSRAVRRFYDPTGQTFNSKLVARDAFLAGNDLLYLGNFKATSDEDSYTSIMATLDSFTQKYREDPAFAQRVDESVLRILTLKYRLYNNSFSLTQTIPSQVDLNQVGQAGQVTFDVAMQAATLISPSQDELADVLPAPPGQTDHMVFISDVRTVKQCSRCVTSEVLAADALEKAVVRLYSPQGVGLVLPRNLVSYTFTDLMDMLDAGTGVKQIENDLRQASWIVLTMLNVNTNIPSSLALRRFLAERPDLLSQKKVVAFAFNAPYYLGATDISKLTAYYGLYSRAPQFVDVTARLLFQEIQTKGKLPVSVPGIGYDINNATYPDPTQKIPLLLDIPQQKPSPENTTPSTPEPTPVYRIGELVPVRTGVIVDYNGHPVPDETVVRFILVSGDPNITKQVEAQTVAGVAKASLRLDQPGIIEIRVESNEAKVSDVVRFDIPSDLATATVPPPTPMPTDTPTPTATEIPSPTPTTSNTPTIGPTVTVTLTPTPTLVPPLPPRSKTYIGEWLLALLIAAMVGTVNYTFAVWLSQVRWGVRGGFLAFIGGLVAYSYLALGMPGSVSFIRKLGTGGVSLCTFLGAVLGVGCAWIWKELQDITRRKPNGRAAKEQAG